jgi:hypothetical protein
MLIVFQRITRLCRWVGVVSCLAAAAACVNAGGGGATTPTSSAPSPSSAPPASTAPGASTSSNSGAPHFILGIETSLKDGAPTFNMVKALGVQSVRLDAPWGEIEKSPGQYAIPSWVEETVNQSLAMHAIPVLILDYGNALYGGDKPTSAAAIGAYANYAAYVVSHFKGRVRYFELENEWETHTGRTTPGTPESYLALAKVAYPAIKRANIDSVVLSGGISDLTIEGLSTGWLAHFFELGGLAFVDALSVHTYDFQLKKGDDTPEAAIRLLDTLEKLASQRVGGKLVNIYVTEMGYPTFAGKGGNSPEVGAAYLARFVLLAASRDYCRGVWWYGLKDQGYEPLNKEHHFGLLLPDLTEKPGARMFTVLSGLLSTYTSIEATQNGNNYSVVIGDGASSRVVAWSEYPNANVTTYLTAAPSQKSQLINMVTGSH